MNRYLVNLGKTGEQKAVDYLKSHSFSILKINFRSAYGEIDIIAEKDRTVYFIEVKTRSSTEKGLPHEAVNKTKINHLKKAAQYFLLKYPYKDYKLKLSVISIILNKGTEILKFFENIQ